MKTKKTSAIVLRRTDFSEADRIVNLLTPEGKTSVMAKGVRRQKSKLAGGIEFFSLNEVVIAEGKSNLKTLISARMKEFFGEILKDFKRTEFAYFILKEVSKKAENINSSEFFDITLKTFSALNDLRADLSLIKSWFFIQISQISGEDVNLNYDSMGEKLSAEKKYNFDYYEKVFVKNENGEFDKNHIKFLRLLSSSEPKIITKIIGAREINNQVQDIIQSLGGKI